MEVQDGKAESGANVQQWGADTGNPSAHNVWRLKAVNWGYYYIYSGVADGDTLLLNCTDGKTVQIFISTNFLNPAHNISSLLITRTELIQ